MQSSINKVIPRAFNESGRILGKRDFKNFEEQRSNVETFKIFTWFAFEMYPALSRSQPMSA